MENRKYQNTESGREDSLNTSGNQSTSFSNSLLDPGTPSGSSPASSFHSAPSNTYDDRVSACIQEMDHLNIEAAPNIYASRLATPSEEKQEKFEDFFTVFTDFHDASVKLTVNNMEMQGSGIVFQPDESRLVILTAAHIFEDLTKDSEISIHLETSYVRDGKSKTYKIVEIPLEPSDYEITENYQKDVAVIALGEDAEMEVRKHVQNFPSAGLLDEPFPPAGLLDESFPSAGLLDESNVLFMMIHYANEIRKQVTIARRVQTDQATLQLNLYTDGGPGASGAPIYSLPANVVAIHKGRMKYMPEIKSCILIKDVIDAELDVNGYSHIYEVLSEEDQSRYKYHPDDTQESASDNPFEINEAEKSQRLLKVKIERAGGELLPKHLTIRNIPKISNKETMKYINENHPLQLQQTLLESLGKGGQHKETKQHSFTKEIDSDHFPPYDAYRKALDRCNNAMLKEQIDQASKTGNNLPAITIPYKIHRKLDTTGKSDESKVFRARQATFMSKKKFFDAIWMNFKNYISHGLFDEANYQHLLVNTEQFKNLLVQYREGFEASLQVHVTLEFITERQKDLLLKIVEQNGAQL